MESSGKNVEYLPKSLRTILNNFFVGKEKSVPLASIRQAIMQQVRPKALIVYPFNLVLVSQIQIHRHFGSRFLRFFDSLNKHGFRVSYSEVLKYQRFAAAHQGTRISGVSESSSAEPMHFMHHVADNIDHNSSTLDGRNRFHGMGIICSVITPAVSSSFTIPHSVDVSTEDLIRLTKIERKVLSSSRKPLKLRFIERNKPVNAFDPLSSAWTAMWLLNPRQLLWSGKQLILVNIPVEHQHFSC